MSGSVRVDTRQLERGLRQLAKGLAEGGADGARAAAGNTATSVRAALPVRTGRLRSTVSAVKTGDGWGVTYGGGLRYARPVAAHTGALARGIAGHPGRFGADMRRLAEKEVGRL